MLRRLRRLRHRLRLPARHRRVAELEALLRQVLTGIGRARTLGLAAQMSFWLLLSIVPLAAIAGFATARLALGNSWLGQSMLAAVPPQVQDLLAKQLAQVASWRGRTVAPLAVVSFVWLAATGVHAAFEALEAQTGVTRPWWKTRLLALGTCIVLSLGVAVVTLLAAGLDWLAALAGAHLPPSVESLEHGEFARALRFFLAALVALGMEAGLYRVAIPETGAPVPVLPGAVAAVVLQVLLGWGYGLYVTTLGARGSAYQAGLAAIGVTMMTLWLFSIALLVGAQLNCVLAERLRRSESWPRFAASSSRPTSPRRPAEPSTGPSSSPHASEHPSR